MTIKIYDCIQGTDEWAEARRGILTASEMHKILTPKFDIANNETSRALLLELFAQRISGFVEPNFTSEAMERGHFDEVTAKQLYAQHYAPVQEVGFITNDEFGFTLGCSPDGLVGDDGMIEIKSRCQKKYMQILLEGGVSKAAKLDPTVQIQTALMVAKRQWCDSITFCEGLPMMTLRVEADAEIQSSIKQAAADFYARIDELLSDYTEAMLNTRIRFIETERLLEPQGEIYI